MPRMNFLYSLLALILLASISSCYVGNDETTPALKAGDTVTNTIETDDGQVEYSEVQRVVEIEPAVAGNPAVLVLLTESALRNGLPDASSTPVTYADIQNFLDSTWDGYIGGKEDEGKNSYELFRYLAKWGISYSSFAEMFSTWTGSIGDLVGLLEDIHGLNMHAGDDVWHFDNFLDSAQVSAQEFKAALDASGTTVPAFFTKFGGDFHLLYKAFSYSTAGNFAAFVQTVMAGNTSSTALGISEAGVEITKMVWDIIKDGKPKIEADGAYARVLNPHDDNWSNYEYSKSDQTRTSTFTGKDYLGLTLYKVKLQAQCTYHASSPTYGGLYIPNVYVDPAEAYALWPWSINATVTVSNVTNFGSVASPNPGITSHVQMKFTQGLQNIQKSKDYHFYADLGCFQDSQK